MAVKCFFGHKWNGCKCVKCGKTRDEGHVWISGHSEGCVCKFCGKKQSHVWDNNSTCKICGQQCVKHDWTPTQKKQCNFVCKICGVIEILHQEDGCICKVCGCALSRWSNPTHNWKVVGKNKVSRSVGEDKVDFQSVTKICQKCSAKENRIESAYCPSCGQLGGFNWTSDGDYAEFTFYCKACGHDTKIEYREEGSALGRT